MTLLKFLIKINCDAIKIASAEMVNFPLLELVGKSKIPIILSTGMNYWEEIVESVNFLKASSELVFVLSKFIKN